MEIGNGVCIGPHSIVRRSNLGEGVLIKPQCIIEDAENRRPRRGWTFRPGCGRAPALPTMYV